MSEDQTDVELVNSNCLDGYACPGCGSLGPFVIAATCIALVNDDGVQESWDYEWGAEATMTCSQCSRNGAAETFQTSLAWLLEVKTVESGAIEHLPFRTEADALQHIVNLATATLGNNIDPATAWPAAFALRMWWQFRIFRASAVPLPH